MPKEQSYLEKAMTNEKSVSLHTLEGVQPSRFLSHEKDSLKKHIPLKPKKRVAPQGQHTDPFCTLLLLVPAVLCERENMKKRVPYYLPLTPPTRCGLRDFEPEDHACWVGEG